jgi:hypothetical protein
MTTTDFDIEQLNRDGNGVWHAVVRAGELVVELCNDSGSWMTPALDARGTRREALPAVASALQKRIRLAPRSA